MDRSFLKGRKASIVSLFETGRMLLGAASGGTVVSPSYRFGSRSLIAVDAYFYYQID